MARVSTLSLCEYGITLALFLYTSFILYNVNTVRGPGMSINVRYVIQCVTESNVRCNHHNILLHSDYMRTGLGISYYTSCGAYDHSEESYKQ